MLTLLGFAEQFGEQFPPVEARVGHGRFSRSRTIRVAASCGMRAKIVPTQIAREWRDKLRFVFVDEYQDINAAQDKIHSGARARIGEWKPFPGRRREAKHLPISAGQSRIFFRITPARGRRSPLKTCFTIDEWDGAVSPRAGPERQPPGGAVGTPRTTFSTDSGTAISLAENFRSHEGIRQLRRFILSTGDAGGNWRRGLRRRSQASASARQAEARPLSVTPMLRREWNYTCGSKETRMASTARRATTTRWQKSMIFRKWIRKRGWWLCACVN